MRHRQTAFAAVILVLAININGSQASPQILKVKSNSTTCKQQKQAFAETPPLNEICAVIGPDIYECVNGVCCTPGSPESLCCPLFAPLCVDGGCCATGRPKVFDGLYCCEEDNICCPVIGCCEATSTCCSTSCCDAGEFCCGANCCEVGKSCCGTGCCETDQKCCASTCCANNQTCCGDRGDQCCNSIVEDRCEKESYNDHCSYSFDAIPCDSPYDFNQFVDVITTLSPSCSEATDIKHLYRVLRDDESCTEGLVPKNPVAARSTKSYLNCRNTPGYKSQFLSFTTSPEVAIAYLKLTGLNRIGIVEMKQSIRNTCSVLPIGNATELGTKTLHVSSQFAIASCEVLMICNHPLPCKEVSF